MSQLRERQTVRGPRAPRQIAPAPATIPANTAVYVSGASPHE
jgi:hypothetical protein